MALRGFMARGERAGESATEPEMARPVVPTARAMRTVASSTSVDASSELEGRLRCRETLRIDGHVKGEVECEKAVLVGEQARVLASIVADEVRISGVVEGNITAQRKITLERTATVVGDLATPGIVIEEGAKLKGRIVIGSDAEPAADSKPAKKSQAPSRPQAASPKSDGAPAPRPASTNA
jgi:cytoskeletal protein CcmA (bactofilin family)